MPKSCINISEYKKSNIGCWVQGQLRKKKRKKQELAEFMGITRQGLDWKVMNNSFSYQDLLDIFEFFESTNEDILFLFSI